MYDPKITMREMMAAGRRLLNALSLEEEFRRLHADNPEAEVFRQWQASRRLVTSSQRDYDESAERHHEAIRGSVHELAMRV
jgi:hypothetical protein